ncbi:hypothetical protein [Leisingera aquaemixtae]|uniref:hypothetical protein n=1 Tax=Leisingera aquaemixtae TaxID=1396826 RepID=UPI0021A807FA|nr:hypothetical protein [Leisingera aquaemixtae]UWQ47296.1 hypothetical protein K3719_08010 [Leisingera aquaemixtae]
MTEILDLATLKKIIGPIKLGSGQERNASSFLLCLNTFRFQCGLNRYHRLAHFLGQSIVESGGFRYDRELWGPTSEETKGRQNAY